MIGAEVVQPACNAGADLEPLLPGGDQVECRAPSISISVKNSWRPCCDPGSAIIATWVARHRHSRSVESFALFSSPVIKEESQGESTVSEATPNDGDLCCFAVVRCCFACRWREPADYPRTGSGFKPSRIPVWIANLEYLEAIQDAIDDGITIWKRPATERENSSARRSHIEVIRPRSCYMPVSSAESINFLRRSSLHHFEHQWFRRVKQNSLEALEAGIINQEEALKLKQVKPAALIKNKESVQRS
ncbi:hypothetical protein NL676_005277 [Syzygium grande]|nr:hypothetical protein NL676_005277 [Syzygium grande]